MNWCRIGALILGLFPLLFSPAPKAWGVIGHEVVAALAEARMSTATKAAIARLLGQGASLTEAANWADRIKGERPETRTWHYANIPLEQPGYDASRADSPNIVTQTGHFMKVLADSASGRDQRAEALKWLLHLVGDLHQPLHVADRRDRGGNDVHVRFRAGKTNLHAYYDYALLEDLNLDRKRLSTLLEREIRHQAGFETSYAQGTPIEWVNETHAKGYQVYRHAGSLMDTSMIHELEQGYINLSARLVFDQLKIASIRLAHLLNSLLDPSYSADPEALNVADGEASLSSLDSRAGETDKRSESEESEKPYAWSASSKVYHRFECSSVRRIKSGNLKRGITPPPGKRPHQKCNR